MSSSHSPRISYGTESADILRVRQQGVAVITALLLTTLAITIVASLFWQQQVQVRSIENQRMQLQKHWILRGALDWARLILREDGKYSAIDDLSEPWAVPLSETRLDQYVDAASREVAPSATLSGSIQDAQARFNLTRLAASGEVLRIEVAAFERLLSALQQNPSLARAAAEQIAASQRHSDLGTDAARPISFLQVDDLLAVAGFTPAVIAAIRDEVIFLPRATPLNVNTASAPALVARLPALSLSDANALIARRRTAAFVDLNDFKTRVPGVESDLDQLSVATRFFLVIGRVSMRESMMQVQALIERQGAMTSLLWVREI
jgi:general secretion pathway protein K